MSTATALKPFHSTSQPGPTRDEAEIRKLIAAWSRALEPTGRVASITGPAAA